MTESRQLIIAMTESRHLITLAVFSDSLCSGFDRLSKNMQQLPSHSDSVRCYFALPLLGRKYCFFPGPAFPLVGRQFNVPLL